MRLAIVQVAICLSLAPTVLKGQLYLLSGTPGYALDLVAVGDSGVKSTMEILPQAPQVAGWWAAISYDTHEDVATAVKEGARVLVVGFDQTAVVKQCIVPGLPSDELEGTLTNQWLAHLPGGELTLELLFARRNGRELRSEGLSMSLDPDTPCDRSFSAVPPYDSLRYIAAGGTSGVADITSKEGNYAKVAKSGDLVFGTTGVEYGYQIPLELRRDLGDDAAGIVINSSQVLVVAVTGSNRTTRFLAMRKRDKAWTEIPVQVEQYGLLRGFGSFIAAIENVAKPPEPRIGTAAAAERAAVKQPAAESAGRSEWRTQATRTGPSIAESFDDASAIYPGRLDVYNIDTEKLFTITTNQGDSEILLIEENTVYYRVSDRLYKASIT